jgi:hypothetical protein
MKRMSHTNGPDTETPLSATPVTRAVRQLAAGHLAEAAAA